MASIKGGPFVISFRRPNYGCLLQKKEPTSVECTSLFTIHGENPQQVETELVEERLTAEAGLPMSSRSAHG